MLVNEILFILYTLVSYSGVILANKVAGKEGLIAWIALAIIVANTSIASIGTVFGIPGFSFGSVIFTTIFLALNVLQEDYEKEATKNGIKVLVFSAIIFTILMLINSYLIPEDYDTTTSNLKALFKFGSFSMCDTISSIITTFLATKFNVYLYEKFKNSKLWIKNNVSTIISNCSENFLFIYLGMYILPLIFLGETQMSFRNCTIITLTKCFCEAMLSFLDTPFLYIDKIVNGKNLK